jgi:hypothetical protein
MSKASRRRNAIQDERDAEANFLYAANLGNAVRLGGPSSAALSCPPDQSNRPPQIHKKFTWPSPSLIRERDAKFTRP